SAPGCGDRRHRRPSARGPDAARGSGRSDGTGGAGRLAEASAVSPFRTQASRLSYSGRWPPRYLGSERGARVSSVDELILTRRERWESLKALLDRAGSDPRRLEAADIERLSALYRQVVADLALARRDFPGDQVVAYLNGLAARAYPLVYRAPVGSWR